MAIYSQSLEGLDELIADFMKIGETAMPKLNTAVTDAGNVVLEKAKSKVSVRTGKLRESLKLKKGVTKGYKAYTTVTWGNDVREYAAPLELGHAIKFQKDGKVMGHVAPRPFLRPAADESEQQVTDVIVDGINKALEEMGGR